MSERPSRTLVTGASSGIGAAVARRLSTSRALVLHGRNEKRLEELAAELPGKPIIWKADFAHPSSLSSELAQIVNDESITIEALVHCAGIVRVLPLRDMDPSSVAELVNVNFAAAVQLVRTLVQRRVNGTSLRNVIFLSSTHAHRGAKGIAVYAGAKAALEATARAMAIELAPGVRVNSIVSGGVETPMSADAFSDPERRAAMEREYPLRVGAIDDVVGAIEFLLSDASSWITGTTLTVDGGFLAR
jgi:NAD(P)-dependent dehydrogenase (short-subunit alcohol dehydrogenase family)